MPLLLGQGPHFETHRARVWWVTLGVNGVGDLGLLLFSLLADIDLSRHLGLFVLSVPWREHPCDWGVWQ